MKYNYYLIDAQDINKKIYESTRRMVANDFVNDYDEVGTINAKELFENIPNEYRKIILKVPNSILKRKNGKEYFTCQPFKISYNNKKDTISAKNVIIPNMFTWIDESIFIEGKIKKLTIDEVKTFYEIIRCFGLENEYFEDLSNLFNPNYKPKKVLKMTKK